MASTSRSSIEHIADIIYGSIRDIQVIKKISSAKKRTFCHDLAFVVLGVRTGYLVDVILPSDPVQMFSSLLQTLRLKSPLFLDIIHILDPTCCQSFLVNGPLLRHRLLHLGDVKFVHIPSSDSCHLGIPTKVRETLESLVGCWDATKNPLTLSLPLRDSSVSVPVAAVLIDYPVAFVPELTITSLNYVPLDVYECIVKYNSHTHTLLKFSCPAELGMKHPDMLSPNRLLVDLQSVFRSKERLGRWEGADLQVIHRIEKRDRVAL